MSQRTATYHKYQIMKKIGAKSTAEPIRYAVKNHIVAA
jgi:DNA-binding CsgD family transcriptional regulator